MKEQYKKLQLKIKKILSKKSFKEQQHHATHDWLIALSVAVLFISVLCAVGVYIFFFRYAEEVEHTSETQPIKTFKKEELYQLVEQYEKEEKTFNDLKEVSLPAPTPGQNQNSESQPVEEIEQGDQDTDTTAPKPTM